MKKWLLMILIMIMVFSVIGCSNANGGNNQSSNTIKSNLDVRGNTEEIEIKEDNVNSSFSLVDEEGNNISSSNSVYLITKAGTFVASGKLENGQIYVNAPDLEVTIELVDVSITNTNVSPIFVKDCDNITIKVKKDTTNYIYDNRNVDYSSSTDDLVGTAAIYVANGNLKINGKGSIVITSNYNSGIHCKDNVTIKNCTMLIKAMNNGIKGNDQVKIEENPTIGIVCGNNGIKTSNSDLGSSLQHGTIYINGGTITINSYGDGIDAAYSVEIGTSVDSNGITYTPVIDIYTNKYSSYTKVGAQTTNNSLTKVGYFEEGGRPGGGGFNGGGFSGGTSSEKADDSAKGIKANELINIVAGEIFIYSYDDGIHTNNNILDTGSKAKANININGGNIVIKASDDAIHADGTLTISKGNIVISESHEGLEANIINIQGGEIIVFANDDGVNATSAINISGGVLDVTVSPNGDTDGIDSNGTITISGGVTITRGPNSEMAAPIDADKTMKMTGGTLIVIGFAPRKLTFSGITKTTLSTCISSGNQEIIIGEQTIKFNNAYTYKGSCTVYGSGQAKTN